MYIQCDKRHSSRTTSCSEGPYFISGEFDRLEVITTVIPGCSVPSPPVLGCDYAEHREKKQDEPLESLQIKVMTPEGGDSRSEAQGAEAVGKME